jgi:hypothetical protein
LHIQKDNHNEQFFSSKHSIVKLNDTQIFSSKLCYDNVDDYNVF